eukprot:Skav231289  [mRNA]  locus=scaffold161:191449:193518:+ [translate_table: standard]
MPEPHRASPRSPARDPQTSPVGVHAVQDDYLTRDQLREMITGANIAIDDNIEGLLDKIFQEMDIGTGHVGRRDLWQKLDKFLPSGEEDEIGAGPGSLQPRMPSPPPPAPLPERRHESPRSASGYPLGSQAWELLHRIYSRLAGPDAKVQTISLIEEIRHDVHVRSERLLERPVVGIGFGQGPSISLDAALQHVLRQVAGERSVLDFTTWERFNWLLIEAQRSYQMSERSYSPRPQAMDPRQPAGRPGNSASSQSPREGRPGRPQGWSDWVLSAGGSSMSSCPNPDQEPGGAIEWMGQELGFDREVLYRLFDMFRQGGAQGRRVGRDRFIQMVQASPRLRSALMITPLIHSTRVIQPMNWGDFLWYLSQVDAGSISWSDVLATACWCRLVSLGLASGRGHPSEVSPRYSAAESRARLDEFRRLARLAAEASPPRPSSPSRSPSRSFAVPSTTVPPVQKLSPKIPPREVFSPHSPLAAVESAFARASGGQPRPPRHPFLDADEDPPRFRGDWVSSTVNHSVNPAMPTPPPPPPLAEPAGPDTRRLRFQVSRSYDPAEQDKIAAELRKILDMRIKSVKWQDQR